MTEQLGRIEKPDAQRFEGKRKLYVITLVFSSQDAPADYVEKYNRYWELVAQHLANLESKIGKANHIYHESISMPGESGLKVVEKLNPASYKIALEKSQDGATFEATEDRDLTNETLDWERFILIGFVSEKVARMISEFYVEASRKRYEYIAQKIKDTLKENEAGILFIREGHRVQFPPDIEVFSVAPPVLDEIRRWESEQRPEEGEKPQEEQNEEKK